MKKSVFILLLLVSISLSFYFAGKTALKTYFNQRYFYTPSLVGLNIDDVTKSIEDSPVKILKVSDEFSKERIGDIFMQDPKPGTVIKKGRILRVWVSKGAENFSLPNVIGLNVLDAKSIIETQGFSIGTISTVSMNLPSGTIVATDPEPESITDKKRPINLLVNKESESSHTKMPDIIGIPLHEAEAILKNHSLLLGTVTNVEYEGIEPGIIIESNIEFNSTVPTGAMINVKVSK